MIDDYTRAELLERARRLRWRLTIYCGIWLVYLVAASKQYWPIGGRSWGETEARELARIVPQFALFLGGLWWIRWAREARTLVKVAVGLVAGALLLSHLAWLREGRAYDQVWANTITRSTFIWFLLATILIPWSFRAGLLAAGLLVAMDCAVAWIAAMRGTGEAWWQLRTLVLVPLMVGPLAGSVYIQEKWFRKAFRVQYERMKYRQVQGELASARRIHEALLPAPQRTGKVRFTYSYEPMSEIGGDFLFAHMPAGEDRLTLLLVDVMGHGIGAALTVNRLAGELERIFAEGARVAPREAIRLLNRYVHVTLARQGIFATAICVEVDGLREKLVWCGAGHPPALLVRKDGACAELASQCTMLGVDADGEFLACEEELDFTSEAAIVAYTDGAEEARNEEGVMFGVERVRQTLSQEGLGTREDWPEKIMASVGAHRGGPPQDDVLIAAAYLCGEDTHGAVHGLGCKGEM